jgi:3-hydroxyacyl-CoA dehydrogenase
MSGVSKVCVIGAGTMGAGIAAQVANAGVPVLLLDMVTEGPDRSVVARKALEKLGKAEPAAFMSKQQPSWSKSATSRMIWPRLLTATG